MQEKEDKMAALKDTGLIKISVKIKGLPLLVNYNTELPMKNNIEMIISKYNYDYCENPMDENKSYGLKLLKDPKFNKNIVEHYITEEHFNKVIKDGYEMELVDNVQDTVREVFQYVDNERLLALSYDKVVIQEIVETNRHGILLGFILNGRLNDTGESGALNMIYHLLKTGYLRYFESEFVKKVVEIAQNYSSSSTFALSLIVLILSSKREALAFNKDDVMEHLTVPHVMQNFNLRAEQVEEGFYLKVFTLINYMLHCSKAEKRTAILFELNTMENREKFYRFLKTNTNIDKKLAGEIFVLQARLLTNTYFHYYTNTNARASTIYEQSIRTSVMSDEYDFIGSKRDSRGEDSWVRNLHKADSMYSIASSDIYLSSTSESPLLTKCLAYGRAYYHIYFESLEKSDYSCDAELNTIGQNIIKLLTNLFCIGMKIHSNNFCLPVYFAPNKIITQHGERICDFLEEVFVKTLMMLFRTKAEMKAKTKEDFKKLYQVVNKQLKIIVKKRPFSFEEWDNIARDVTNAKLQEILQEERDARWKYLYENNKCLKDLAVHFSTINHEVIRYQRYEVLSKGFIFPNMHYRKGDNMDPSNKHTHFSLHLVPGYQKLWYEDHTEYGKLEGGDQYPIDVNSIKFIVIDENCQLIITKSVPHNKRHLVFTIVYGNANCETISLDCYFDMNQNRTSATKESKFYDLPKDFTNELEKEVAKEKAKKKTAEMTKKAERKAKEMAKMTEDLPKLAQTWKEGLFLLKEKDITKNEDYTAELNALNKMDCALQLIELQDVEIPVEAPTIPPLPD